VGQVSVNISRYCDEDVDENLASGRATDDPDQRYDAYESVQTQLNTDVVFVWLNSTIWALAADPAVKQIAQATLPDGSARLGFVEGRTPMAEVWIESEEDRGG
jgi:ABC-type transport system substrate-binding protein